MNLDFDQSQKSCEKFSSINQDAEINKKVNHGRRSAVHKIAVTTAALACCSALPQKWTTPILEFGALPAHATTSGAVAAIVEELEAEIAAHTSDTDAVEAAAVTDTDDNSSTFGYTNSERINRTGDIYIDGIIRSKYVSPKNGKSFGTSMLIVFSNGTKFPIPNTAVDVNTVSGRGYRPGGLHPEIPTMEVYADLYVHPDYITIYYNG